MAIDPRLARGVALALALAAGAALAAEAPPPGVKRVCVPAEDGRTWECGTSDDPPPQRPVAPRPAPAPPAFLAAPGDAIVTPIEEAPAPEPEPIAQEAADEQVSQEAANEQVSQEAADEVLEPAETTEATAPTEAAASIEPEVAEPTVDPPENDTAPVGGAEAPTADAQSTEAPAPAEPPPPQAPTGSAPPPFLAAPSDPYRAVPLAPATSPAPRQAVVQEPIAEAPVAEELAAEPPVAEQPVAEQPVAEQPVAEQPVEEEPIADEPVAAEPVAEPPVEAEPVVAAPAQPAAPTAQPRGEFEFLALEPAGYTVQLAHGRDRDAFSAALAALGPAAANAYLLPFDRDGVRWWMLVWSQFPDAAAARAAIATLPREAATNVGHPRRVALLQRELRR